MIAAIILLLQSVPVLAMPTDPPATCGSVGQIWLNTASGDRWQCSGSSYTVIPYPAGGGVAWGAITGTLNNQTDLQSALNGKQASGTYSGTGACGANQWASTLNTGAPTCAQPGFSNLSGSATDAQIPNTITLDNLTQITARAIADTTGTLVMARGGTDQTTAPDDNVLVGSGTSWVLKAINDCQGAGKALTYTAATNTFGCNTISGGSGPTIARKPADQSSTSTSFADVTGLTFAIAASTVYSITCEISYLTAATTTALQISLNGPASPTAVRFTVWTATSATASFNASQNAYDANTNPASALTTALPVRLTGTVENGVNAGTLALRMRTEINASSVTIQRGSWCALY